MSAKCLKTRLGKLHFSEGFSGTTAASAARGSRSAENQTEPLPTLNLGPLGVTSAPRCWLHIVGVPGDTLANGTEAGREGGGGGGHHP